MAEEEIKVGDRVRLNALGKERNPNLKGERGVVKSRTRGAAFYILIDGNKSTSILHRTYIEPDEL
jgi:hypothetical protein